MTARRIWSVAAVAGAALVLTGCPSQDVDADDVEKTLTEAGATDEQAACVARELDKELDKDQMNDVGNADNLDELSDGLREIVDTTLTTCLTDSAPSDTEAENEAETTDTTVAEGTEATTTTVG